MNANQVAHYLVYNLNKANVEVDYKQLHVMLMFAQCYHIRNNHNPLFAENFEDNGFLAVKSVLNSVSSEYDIRRLCRSVPNIDNDQFLNIIVSVLSRDPHIFDDAYIDIMESGKYSNIDLMNSFSPMV